MLGKGYAGLSVGVGVVVSMLVGTDMAAIVRRYADADAVAVAAAA